MQFAKETNVFKRKFVTRLILAAAVLTIGILYYLYILSGNSGQCLFYNIFHRPCPSCGATTVVLSVLSGDFKAAITANPVLTLAIFPLIIIFTLQDFLTCLYGFIKKRETFTLFEFLINKQNF